jgi:glycosyltransferase involved in cell wall biosynthesis
VIRTHLPPLLITALTQGSRVPSSRFRVMQHVGYLRLRGLTVNHLPARFSAYPPTSLAGRAAWFPAAVVDAVQRALATRSSGLCLLQRELVSTLRTAEPLIRCPLVFDVDDAIYLHRRGAQSDAIARQARLVICGNRVLAEHYVDVAPVAVLPTAVDTERFVPAATDMRSPPVIGWSGSSSGFAYLEWLQPALKRLLERDAELRLVIMADRAPSLPLLPQERVQFVPWSEDLEVSVLQTFNVGIMPLADDPWSRGKCSYKMLTYMACGIPVVVSPVGMNADVLAMGELGYGPRNQEEWVDAIEALLADAALGRRMGQVGRSVVEAHFSCDVIAPRLAELLIGVVA